MKKGDIRLLSNILMAAALVAVVLSGIGYLGTDIWLASTQWLLVASVFALFAIYLQVTSR